MGRVSRRPLQLLISSGPTREPIDPVRFLSNYSTGYMGAQLASEALARGHRVTVVSGPSEEPLPAGARVIAVDTAAHMDTALRRCAPRADAIVMAAAVADFRPAYRSAVKRPRRAGWTLRLRATPDIVSRLPRRRGQVVCGFALETGAALARARRKLHAKRLDVVVAQQASRQAVPFGRRRVTAWLLERSGGITALGRASKGAVARALLDKIEGLWYGQRETHAR